MGCNKKRHPHTLNDVEEHGGCPICLDLENELLREALESIEWIDCDGFFFYCPWCNRDKVTGHDKFCKRQIALRGWNWYEKT